MLMKFLMAPFIPSFDASAAARCDEVAYMETDARLKELAEMQDRYTFWLHLYGRICMPASAFLVIAMLVTRASFAWGVFGLLGWAAAYGLYSWNWAKRYIASQEASYLTERKR